MQKETVFKKKVMSFLKTLPLTWFVKIQQVALRGTPDILACINGVFIALELKASNESPISLLQEFNLASIKKAGGVGLVVTPETWFTDRQVLASLSKTDIMGVS